ncbi:hypothetical protein C5167_031792 [Papaver somniferum]|uniref:Zinc finger PHD-type domain-containing protein n=1 Tax=Papaver somniferum TaxID=3469 RepID=A0A4Y7K5J0_PAPSO|nr:PHD finger protein MALE MEIOCYTE DEATH 1-like [Papaver somniferum]RZC68623.1 hypothetical protein C5167_031792 [Papaver somniferum]
METRSKKQENLLEKFLIKNCNKKRKFKETKQYGFHTFGEPGYPSDFTGTFRQNIRKFIKKCGEEEGVDIEGWPTWCTLLVHEKMKDDDDGRVMVPLYTIEERVKHSKKPFCDQCRSSGWGHHFVSKRRYHLIIPVQDEWHKFPNISLFDQTHLLHGLIHCNGFGHLLSINGFEGGSKFLSGQEIMDFWDRICTALKVRKISVEDVSKKGSMDLRLLYGVADGRTWFGRWGYKFCRGSFNVTKNSYDTAIRMLSWLNLDKIIKDSGNKDVEKIIGTYRELSDTKLITMKDLLRFMLFACKALSGDSKPHSVIKPITGSLQESLPFQDVSSKHGNRKNKDNDSKSRENYSNSSNKISTKKICSCSMSVSFAEEMPSRWPAKRLEYAAGVIMGALREKDSGMSRQEVRDAARVHIGDTGLLDFVLKSSDNLIVGDYFVSRSRNSKTHTYEFKSCKCRNLISFAAEEATSNWSARKLEDAAEIIVNALKRKRSRMSREELKEAARSHIGDTGLLDYVLKSINNVIVGEYVVRRVTNPSTKKFEFEIHELHGEDVCKPPESTSSGPVAPESTSSGPVAVTNPKTKKIEFPLADTTSTATSAAHITCTTPGLDLYNDVLYLFREVLLQGYDEKIITDLSSRQLSARAVLGGKHFVKEWPLSDEDDNFLSFVCRLKPSLFEDGQKYELSRSFSPPGELVVVPLCTTIGELKKEIQWAFRDTYCLLETFDVTEIEGDEGLDEGEVVSFAGDIWVSGNGLGEGSDRLKYEGGTDSWTIDCSCGAKDVGGERMVTCSICEVGKHTRCSDIDNAEAVPWLYVCADCNAAVELFKLLQGT